MDIEKLAEKARAQLKSEKKPEARDAGPSSSLEKEKTKGKEEMEAKLKVEEEARVKAEADKEKANAEAQAKRDEEILSKKDEELKEDELVRKSELLKIKEKQDLGDKEKKIKDSAQKRIDEVQGELKALRHEYGLTKFEKEKSDAKIKTLEDELNSLKKDLGKSPQDKVKDKVKGEVKKLREKYLEEDKSLSKEDRREMTQEELDEWRLEDSDAVTEWVTKRTLRRAGEEQKLMSDEVMDIRANEILNKQEESQKRVFAKHPDLNNEARKDELLKQGKSKEEVLKILSEENPKYKLCVDILNENREKYMLSPDGPELIIEEMEKRLNKKPDIDTEKEELKKKLLEKEAEITKLKNLDTDITSTHIPTPEKEKTELEKERERIARKVGLDPAKVKKRVEERIAKGYES